MKIALLHRVLFPIKMLQTRCSYVENNVKDFFRVSGLLDFAKASMIMFTHWNDAKAETPVLWPSHVKS